MRKKKPRKRVVLKTTKDERLLSDAEWAEYCAAHPGDWEISPDEENNDTILAGELAQANAI